jgi:hypothetical protein
MWASSDQGPPVVETVKAFAAQMGEGVRFPLIAAVVSRFDQRFHVVDGHYRVAASQLYGFMQSICVMHLPPKLQKKPELLSDAKCYPFSPTARNVMSKKL